MSVHEHACVHECTCVYIVKTYVLHTIDSTIVVLVMAVLDAVVRLQSSVPRVGATGDCNLATDGRGRDPDPLSSTQQMWCGVKL